MNQLIRRVAENVGISEDQARKAVDIVAAFFKEKLPGLMSGQIDRVLGQSDPVAEAARQLGSKFGL